MQKIKDIQKPPDVHISVENFGPIEKAKIDLRPLTVFVGESNTGKTYLSALIYALYQIFEGFDRIPWLNLIGSHLNFRDRSRILSAQPQEKLDREVIEVLEKLNTHGRPFTFSDLPVDVRSWMQSNLKKPIAFKNELQRCFNLESVSNLMRFTSGTCSEMRVSLKLRDGNQSLWFVDMHNSGSNLTADGSVNSDIVLKSGEAEVLEMFDFQDLVALLRVPMQEVAESYYLPAARSGIMQSHGVIASSLVDRATRVGLERFPEIPTFSGIIADFLKQIINYKERGRSPDRMIDIASALEVEVLRGKIEVKRPAAGYPEFLYRPQKAKQSLSMSQSSSMISELAPLVLFLRGIVRPGDTLIIEEPEAHLHPRAQTKIALILARLVRVGVRVIITTHSDWLLEQIGNLIREGEVMKLGKNKMEPTTWLTAEEVGAWLFRMDEPVKEIPFEHIAGIEPEEYGEVAEKLYNRSVDLRTQLEEAAGGTAVE